MFIELRVYCKLRECQKLFIFDQNRLNFSFTYQGIIFESVCYEKSYLPYIVLFSKPSQNQITGKNDPLIKNVCDYISNQLQCPVEMHITMECDYYSENGVEVPKFDARNPNSRACKLGKVFSKQMDIIRCRIPFM